MDYNTDYQAQFDELGITDEMREHVKKLMRLAPPVPVDTHPIYIETGTRDIDMKKQTIELTPEIMPEHSNAYVE